MTRRGIDGGEPEPLGASVDHVVPSARRNLNGPANCNILLEVERILLRTHDAAARPRVDPKELVRARMRFKSNGLSGGMLIRVTCKYFPVQATTR